MNSVSNKERRSMRFKGGKMLNYDHGYVPPDSAEELLRRYGSGERQFPNCELSDENLVGTLLSGAVFDGSWFSDTSFDGADLRRTSFRDCNVKGASFRGTGLREASFAMAGVEAADYEGARLDGATFEGASYYGYTIHDGDGFPNG